MCRALTCATLLFLAVLQDMLATVGGKGGGKEGMAQGFLASPDLASLQRWARLTTQ